MLLYDKLEKERFDVTLIDDGTLDTVLDVYSILGNDSQEVRFDCEYASQYRNKNGSMTIKGFKKLAREAIEAYYEARQE